MLDHAVSIFVARHAALAAHRFPHVGEGMHAGGVHPGEERLVGFTCPVMKSIAAAVVSSSMVSIRLLFSGPVSSILPIGRRLETRHAANWT